MRLVEVSIIALASFSMSLSTSCVGTCGGEPGTDGGSTTHDGGVTGEPVDIEEIVNDLSEDRKLVADIPAFPIPDALRESDDEDIQALLDLLDRANEHRADYLAITPPSSEEEAEVYSLVSQAQSALTVEEDCVLVDHTVIKSSAMEIFEFFCPPELEIRWTFGQTPVSWFDTAEWNGSWGGIDFDHYPVQTSYVQKDLTFSEDIHYHDFFRGSGHPWLIRTFQAEDEGTLYDGFGGRTQLITRTYTTTHFQWWAPLEADVPVLMVVMTTGPNGTTFETHIIDLDTLELYLWVQATFDDEGDCHKNVYDEDGNIEKSDPC